MKLFLFVHMCVLTCITFIWQCFNKFAFYFQIKMVKLNEKNKNKLI
jgi:hypothetical protein